jgi:hypothetical protein
LWSTGSIAPFERLQNNHLSLLSPETYGFEAIDTLASELIECPQRRWQAARPQRWLKRHDEVFEGNVLVDPRCSSTQHLANPSVLASNTEKRLEPLGISKRDRGNTLASRQQAQAFIFSSSHMRVRTLSSSRSKVTMTPRRAFSPL